MTTVKKYYENEDDLPGFIEVIYKGEKYITGNRYHDLVELYCDNKLKHVVKIKSVHSED
jgi:hypothetical protein